MSNIQLYTTEKLSLTLTLNTCSHVYGVSEIRFDNEVNITDDEKNRNEAFGVKNGYIISLVPELPDQKPHFYGLRYVKGDDLVLDKRTENGTTINYNNIYFVATSNRVANEYSAALTGQFSAETVRKQYDNNIDLGDKVTVNVAGTDYSANVIGLTNQAKDTVVEFGQSVKRNESENLYRLYKVVADFEREKKK